MVNKLSITLYPSSILRKKSDDVKQITSDIEFLIEDMVETLKVEKGVGIAAPQVGKNIRLVVIDVKDKPLILINPKICSKSWRTNREEEGCLSIPGVFGIVRRYNKVSVSARNKRGEKIEIYGHGLLARILQHEIDHLDGVLFIDKTIRITKGRKLLDNKMRVKINGISENEINSKSQIINHLK